jgi:Ca2+-binding RTX toxin-like protein
LVKFHHIRDGTLAEKQNLFGGLLGSTFNFIFENQMEAIQDGDRLYYLPRIEGIHFGTEIENNTFAQLIMQNTGTHHLSANIFMTPEYVVEAGTVDPNDPSTWLRNSVTGNLLVEVLTNDYVDGLFADGQHHAFDTQVHFIGDDNFFGNTIVLGGTEGRDVLISGQADDDTIYGDGGDDFLDGGNGNDMIFGGTGNDIIRDSAGDDVMHGGTGNDDIDGGLGDDVIFGEDGNDLLHGGNSILGDEIQGGIGNDIIFGDEGDDALIGNEGDDWIEGGAGGDGLVGDGGAPTGQVPLYAGNDVLDGGDQGDKMQGFSGDDIMLGKGGFDKFVGLLGFDWGSFEGEEHGVSVDMTKREFIPNQLAPAGDAVRDFWVETEGVSGSAFDDVLGGTNNARVDTFNELVNVNLIFGLSEFFPEVPVAFSDGNIMLGGGGSDFIEGRGGNDIIDGDAYLHVALTRDANGNIFAGSQIICEILIDQAEEPTFGDGAIDFFSGLEGFGVLTAGDIDTAVFGDVSTAYTIELATDTNGDILLGSDGNPVLRVTHITPTAGAVNDGTDLLHNIERLQFADVTIDNPFAAVSDATRRQFPSLRTPRLSPP